MNCANHPDREHVSFCQNCGKPICGECVRSVGTAVFCEPCLAARLAAATAASPGFVNVPVAGASPLSGAPNPVLAGALGFIPGVGAMYNGQFAKGAVHLIVFVVLVSLSERMDAFGWLVAGWIFYQAFEAYHTARARRDGTPLPNPFGLNDIGERFGFGKAWPAAAPTAYQPPAGPPFVSQFVQAADGSQTFTGGDGAHFHQGADGSRSFRAADGTSFRQEPYTGQAPGNPAAYAGSSWGAPQATYAAPVPPFTDPYAAAAYPAPYADPQLGRSRFPVGAILLIGLGLIFFVGSSGFFHHFPIQRLIPFLLIGVGVWLFVNKMTSAGQAIADDGTSAYRLRVFRALRGPVWIILVGVLFFLDTFNILGWGRSWPLFIIVAGLMTFLERSTSYAAATVPYSYAGPVPQQAAAPPATPAESAAAASTSVVPYTEHGITHESGRDRTRDQEGS